MRVSSHLFMAFEGEGWQNGVCGADGKMGAYVLSIAGIVSSNW